MESEAMKKKTLPTRSLDDLHNTLGQFPHCDALVLHAPGQCEYCDHHPDWQALRLLWNIQFTGEADDANLELAAVRALRAKEGEEPLPCPAERRRPAMRIHRWGGNAP